MHLRMCLALFVTLAPALASAQDGPPQPPWKNQISFPDEPFQSWTSPAFVKFTIIMKEGYDPNLVYFQDSGRYEYHFDFALENLPPFIGMTVEEFDNVTLHAAGQQAVLGAVILPPWHDPPFNEYGIQLVRDDPYTREEVVTWFNTVKSSITADPNVTAYYFAAYEQYPVAQQNRDWFESQGIPVGSTGQWTEGNASYSPGWALGRLQFVHGTDIQSAYTAGELLAGDILLTDGVPAEVPSVAGIVTLMASTPNSHVAILSRSQGVPFVHLAVESDAARARALVGRSVYLAVTDSHGPSCEVRLLDVEFLSSSEKSSLLSLKDAPPLAVQPMKHRGAYWADTNDLQPADICYFGGKAANFGVLRRAVPGASPRAMAFSFDLWNAFLDQTADAASLRDRIARPLSKYATYPPADMQSLTSDLAVIRSMFQDSQSTRFSPELEAAILEALQTFGFDPTRPIRFRSSTNVEDSEQFTGAGLYDSYSGCLADDLDRDNGGPCACDPVESKERGVLRAIRKVFASFYNDNAFLERLKHGVDESQVGMALLVHHSYPDEIELANGVATMERSRGSDWTVDVVSQRGAVSVTNPPMDAVPEVVMIDMTWQGPNAWLVRRSSLMPLRENSVLAWDSEYIELYNLLVAAGDQFCKVTQKEDILLDLEFKKTAPQGKLELKQIREIPRAGGGYATPFLLGEPTVYCTLQGRGGNVFTNHRLKSRWTIQPKSLWLSDQNLKSCIYGQVTIEYAAEGVVRHVACELPSLPGATHSYEPPMNEWDRYSLADFWGVADLSNPRECCLRTTPLFEAVVPDPVVTLSDLRLGIEVDYSAPVPINDVNTITREEVSLYRPWEPTVDDVPEECSFSDPNTGVSITTRFYMRWGWGWDSPTSVQFEQTRIEGLTSEPIILTGYFSQSVGGGSHLCPKNFLFEPALEPGLSLQSLNELEAGNVRLIYCTTGARECRPTEWQDTPPFIRLYGFDEPIDRALDGNQ
ncbi:MAG: hypothetical protein JW955_08825 [Sedimentisphaerales bacterium]|nr:hypothetical protein [Sedimentisphaerales bacterium]